MNKQEFIQKVRAKFPEGTASDGRQYTDIPDDEFANKILEKYPVYRSQITDLEPDVDEEPEEDPGYFERVGGALSERFEDVGEHVAAIPKRPSLREEIGAGLNIAKNLSGAVFDPITELPGMKQVGEAFGGVGQGVADFLMQNKQYAGAAENLAKFLDENPDASDALESVFNVGLLSIGGGTKIKPTGALEKVKSTTGGVTTKVKEAVKPPTFQDVYTNHAKAGKDRMTALKLNTIKYKNPKGETVTVTPLDTLESLESRPKVDSTVNGYKLNVDSWLEELNARQKSLNNQVTAAAEHEAHLPQLKNVSIRDLKARALEEAKRDTGVTDSPVRKASVDSELNKLFDFYEKSAPPEGQIDPVTLNRFRIGANKEAQSYYDAQRLGQTRGAPPRITADTAKAYEIMAGVFRDELTGLRPEVGTLLTKERAIMNARKYANKISQTTVGPSMVGKSMIDIGSALAGSTLPGGPITGFGMGLAAEKIQQKLTERAFTGYGKSPSLRTPQNRSASPSSTSKNIIPSSVSQSTSPVKGDRGFIKIGDDISTSNKKAAQQLENERILKEKGPPKEGTVEALSEKAAGFQAGDKFIIDTAIRSKDAGTVFEMIKEGRVPQAYLKSFSKEIDEILGPRIHEVTTRPNLDGLRRVNPQLFNDATKSKNFDDFVDRVVKRGKTKIENVSVPALREFYDKVIQK